MSEIIVDAVAEKRAPQQLLDTFMPLVDEAKIHFNDDGIHVRAVDPANVGMADVTLDASAFTSYASPGAVTQGANLETLDDRLNLADSADLVNLSLDMETRKLSVDIDNITQAVGLIDPDSIRQEPDLPEMDLPNTVVLTGAQLDRVTTACDMVSDHIEIVGDPDREVVEFIGEGDIDDTVVTFGTDEVQDGTKITTDAASLFSMEYTKNLADPVPKDTAVTIQFGNEFPMIWEWDAVDGHLDVWQSLAPRIQSR